MSAEPPVPPGLRVLLIEDDQGVRRAVGLGLRARGYRVDEAPTAAVALRRVRIAVPDVVLLDLGLPDRDGLHLLPGLRIAAPRAWIVVVSARDEPIDVVDALDAGADDYIRKPFAMTELIARVRAAARHGGSPPGL